jgi:pimeloyl-ACP methyl ester carboxylesterase
MTAIKANGITIEYETFGDAASPPVLLIMGLGAQLTLWDTAFCTAIANAGYYVIRYDNRDVGLSTSFDDATASPAYSMSDMAADAAGLLDALGIESAHIVGASMGGMIAQTFAIEHPTKTRTLVSIMSTTGDRTVGQPTPESIAALLAPPPATRDEAIEAGLKIRRLIGSPAYAFDEQVIRERVAASYDRSFNPAGTARQLAAIMSQPDRTETLGHVTAPVLVIHGEADPLVTPTGGKATAAAIPGARLKLVPGMGHEIPPELHVEIVGELTAHFQRA